MDDREWLAGTARGHYRIHAIQERVEHDTCPLTGGPRTRTRRWARCGIAGGPSLRSLGARFAGNDRGDSTCRECTELVALEASDDLEGVVWTRTCRNCGPNVPATRFLTDKRTRDGLATTCVTCVRDARAAVNEADRIVRSAAQRQNWNDERRADAEETLSLISTWEHNVGSLRCDHCRGPVAWTIGSDTDQTPSVVGGCRTCHAVQRVSQLVPLLHAYAQLDGDNRAKLRL